MYATNLFRIWRLYFTLLSNSLIFFALRHRFILMTSLHICSLMTSCDECWNVIDAKIIYLELYGNVDQYCYVIVYTSGISELTSILQIAYKWLVQFTCAWHCFDCWRKKITSILIYRNSQNRETFIFIYFNNTWLSKLFGLNK